MSLARAFFYSGAKSVVSSLWNADDKSTAKIMRSFYNYLKAGHTKSKALYYAKLDYLKSSSLSEKSPYYWASFVLVGDDSFIKDLSTNTSYYYILSIVTLVLVGLAFIFRRQLLNVIDNIKWLRLFQKQKIS